MYQIEIDGFGRERFKAASDNEAAQVIRQLIAQHPEWPDDRDVIVTDPDGKRWFSAILRFR